MIQEHDKFKNVTAGIQSIAIVIAVIVGGGWTTYLFYTLHTREKSQLDISNAQLAIATQKAKDDREQAIAQLAIEKDKEEREQAIAQLAMAIEKAKEEREKTSAQMAIEKAKDEREQASTQLAMAIEKAKDESRQAEQKRLANYGLDIAIEAKQEQPTDDSGNYISALVKITNKGFRNRYIDFGKSPLLVAMVHFDEHGNRESTFVRAQQNLYKYIVLRSGKTVECPFLVEVPRKGFYFLSYDVPLDDKEMKIHVDSGGPKEEGVSWGGMASVLVK